MIRRCTPHGASLLLALGASLVLVLTLVTPGHTARTVTAVSTGGRIVVTITGTKPAKATLVVAGVTYRLRRSGKLWRTKPLTAPVLTRLKGKAAKVKVTLGGKKRTLRTTIVADTAPNSPTSPTAPTNPTSPTTPAPLFAAPGVDRIGQEAWDAVKGYLADSRLTDCPAGWPACAYEIRYSHFADGTHWYCRLTPTSGSDIKSWGTLQQILGAEQKADGAWGVSYALSSYGNTTVYSVRVAANGAAWVQYWGPGVDINGPPTKVDSGLVWLRGARDCSY